MCPAAACRRTATADLPAGGSCRCTGRRRAGADHRRRLVVEHGVDEVVAAVVGAAYVLDQPDGRGVVGARELHLQVAHEAVVDAVDADVEVLDAAAHRHEQVRGHATGVVVVPAPAFSRATSGSRSWSTDAPRRLHARRHRQDHRGQLPPDLRRLGALTMNPPSSTATTASGWPIWCAGARWRPRELLDMPRRARRGRQPGPQRGGAARCYDQARAAIAAGLPAGPFTGVPYLLKDLGAHYAGAVSSLGGALFKDFVLDHDSEITARLRRAGLVIFGKTNTPEMGLAASTEPRLFGPTRNPWNLGHARAARAAARRPPSPRAWCRWRTPPTAAARSASRRPAAASSASSRRGRATRWARTRARDGAAPRSATRSRGRVRDSAALLDATAGPDVGDPYSAPPPRAPLPRRGRPRPGTPAHRHHDPALERPAGPPRMRRGRARGGAARASGSATTWRRPRRTSTRRPWARRASSSSARNVRAALEARAAALGRELTAGDVERVTWARAMDGHTARAADYARSIGVIHRTGRIVARFFTRLRHPALADDVPAALSARGPRHDDRRPERYAQAVLGTIGFTSLFNQAGTPAMSVPLGWSRDGLPIGIQFAAPYGDEATLFRLAAQLEAAEPWAGRRPPIATSRRQP